MKKLLYNMLIPILAILFFCIQISPVSACGGSSATITSITDLGGGVTRYTFELCPEFNGTEGNPDAFGFEFSPGSVSIVGFSPSSVTTSASDVYTGAISGDDVFWTTGSATPGNSSNTLCFVGYVDVSGTVGDIVGVTHQGETAAGCNVTVYTSNPPPSDLTCGQSFTDSDAGTGGEYQSNENITWLICSSTFGDAVTVTFNMLDIEGGSYDFLNVYDGLDASAPHIALINSDVTLPGPYTSTNANGCLFFTWQSDGSLQYDGWQADVSCTAPVGCQASPTLSWD